MFASIIPSVSHSTLNEVYRFSGSRKKDSFYETVCTLVNKFCFRAASGDFRRHCKAYGPTASQEGWSCTPTHNLLA